MSHGAYDANASWRTWQAKAFKLLDVNDPYESKLLPKLEIEEENRIKFNISIFKRLGVRIE